VDLAVIFDDSNSLSNEIDALKSKVQDLTDQIAASDLDARYALVSFQDHEYLRLSWTKDTASFKNAVNSLKANAGDDTPENALDAIETILKLGFRSDAQKMILIITDAPAHQRGDGTNFTRLTGDNIKADLLKSGALFVVVSPVLPPYVTPNLDLKNLADEVDGTWIDIKSADFSYILDQITTMITGMYVIKYISPDPTRDSPRAVQVSFSNSSCSSGQIISEYTSSGNIYENDNIGSGNQSRFWDAIGKLSSLLQIASVCLFLLMAFLGMRRYGGWNYLRHLITPEVPNNDRENQSAIHMIENRLRIEAYTKFVELMAVRPIDMHYATYKIVPKLEAIQLISSLEVKRTAKNILDEAIAGSKIIYLPKFVRRINEELIPIIKKEIEDIHSDD
jgi:hypothetical protein